MSVSFSLHSHVEESVLPSMSRIYDQDFGNKVNEKQKTAMQHAIKNQDRKLRVMTYNMLYNVKEAEDKLPLIHRWERRLPRLFEYLSYANADIIGSQELQEDQVQELMGVLGAHYDYYGEKTRVNEGRSDVNAIFYNKERVELIEAKTFPYQDAEFENAFTYCLFRDKAQDKKFAVINTKLTWRDPERRLAEAVQLNAFSNQLPLGRPLILLGDFNTFPFIQHARNIFFDGDCIEKSLAGKNLQDAKSKSIFGHFGPLCSITNSRETLEPFVGPELTGFILDHIFVNGGVTIFTHGIDTAKADGYFPSDHFPVIADLFIQ